MPRFIQYTPYLNATLSGALTLGVPQPNTSRSDLPIITLNVVVAVPPTGTSPTLAFNLMASVDGLNFALIGATTPTITAAGTYHFIFQNLYEPIIRLDAVVGGSVVPTFAGVTVNMLTSGTEDA